MPQDKGKKNKGRSALARALQRIKRNRTPAPPVISKAQGATTGTDFKSAAANRGAALRELNQPDSTKRY